MPLKKKNHNTSEQTARLSAAEWQTTFDAVGSAIFLTDQDFTIIKCNRTAKSLFQRSSAEIIGKKCYHLVHGTDKPVSACPLEVIREDKKRHTLTFEQNGRWLEVSADPILDEAGNFTGSVHVVNDITERKRTEQALDEHHSYLKAVLDSVNDAIFVDDADTGKIIDVNQRCCEMYGYTYEEMLRTPIGDLSQGEPPYSQAEAIEWLRKTREEGPQIFEWLAKHKDGRTFWVEVSTRFVVIGGENRFVVVVRDITERKLAEEALRQSEERYRQLFEAESDAVFLIDNQTGRILQANSAACALYGYSLEELLSMTNNDLSAEPEQTQRVTQETPITPEKVVVIPLRWHRKKDGAVFPVEITGRFFTYQDRPVHIAAIRDITERKRAEEALRQSEERHRLIADMMSDYIYSGLVFPDASTVTEWISGAFERITGYSVEEINRLPGGFASLLIPEDLQNVLQQQPRLFERGESSVEYRIRRKDGEIRWLQDNMKFEGQQDQGAFRVIGAVQDITERKLAEEKIRQSEETYRNLFHNAQVGLFRTRISDGKILESNDQLARMFGYANREEFIAEYSTAQNYVDPGTRERMLELLRRDGFVQNFEARFYRKDRSIFWARYSARIYPEQGWIEGVVEDITEQKQAQEKLTQSEAKYRLLAETTPDVIILHDMEGRIEYVNRAGLELAGRTEKEVIGQPIAAFLAAESQNGIRQRKAQRARGDGGVYTYEAEFLDKNGQRHTMEVCSAPIMSEGKIAQILIVARDITERKQMEISIQENQEKYQALFEQSVEGIYLHDAQGRILEVNEVACQQSGYTRQELLQCNVFDLHSPNTRVNLPKDEILRQWSQWQPGQRHTIEGEHQRKDGSVYPVEISTGVVQYGGQRALLAIVKDITERKQAEEAIQRLNAELEARVEERTRQLQEAQEQLVRQEKLAVLGQLAGGVGHELRNPLAVISNAVYFLKLTQPEADPKVREYLDILERETRNAEKIISDLLDFARVRSVERQAISAAELMRRVFERYPVPENIHLVLDLPPDLPPLWVDARQMEQVLGNLVLNAYQAMPSGGELSVISM